MAHGDYMKQIIRSATILTNSYVEGTVVSIPTGFNQGVLYVPFTIGSLTSLEVKVEFSDDNVTYFQETSSSVSSGIDTNKTIEHQMTASGNYRIEIPMGDNFMKVSVKGTGTVTSSNVAVTFIGTQS